MDANSFYTLTPTEFELRCKEILAGYAEKERLQNFKISHNEIISAYDTSYQIDVFASFTALGTTFKVLCECKRYKNPVKQETILTLEGKLRSIGAHKGIVISTSSFQRGAIDYANAHGIALIQVSDHGEEVYSHSSGAEEESPEDPFLYGERRMPPYRAILITGDSDADNVVFPPKSLIAEILREMDSMMEQQYGISRKNNLKRDGNGYE